MQGLLQRLRIMRSSKLQINILNGLSGTIKPGRLTLLLGPPSSGKTTLLKALSGKLGGAGLKVHALFTYSPACGNPPAGDTLKSLAQIIHSPVVATQSPALVARMHGENSQAEAHPISHPCQMAARHLSASYLSW